MDGGRDYEEIWREVGPTLWRAVYAFSGGRREIADDAVAEAFAAAMERNGEVRDPKAYCYRVAFRLAAGDLRRERAATPTSDETAGPAEDQGHEARMDILTALRDLSPTQRAAVYLHYHADLPVREVARLLGASGPAIWVQLMRGRRRLSEVLRERQP